MIDKLEKIAESWILAGKENIPVISGEFYCETRDIFQARLDKMIGDLSSGGKIKENDVYIIAAMAGEIGNNSFDHNLGSWPDVMGVFFGHYIDGNKLNIVIADRGQGLYRTLKRVKPGIKDDSDALFTAFNERISGRAPESRGNGLKFVKENIKERKMHLSFYSGTAKAELNEKMSIEKTDKDIKGSLAVISS